MQYPTYSMGRRVSPVSFDHVHVYSQDLKLSLGPDHIQKANATRTFGDTTRSSSTPAYLNPPLSPGPPLRGYAATPLLPKRAPSPVKLDSERRQQQQAANDEEYERMMQAVLDRTRQQNQAQQQDEDRRLERLLKHVSNEQEFVAEVRARA
jgi:hypothetical protein